ncbi:hypothetical protein PLICRDRAFT_179652 [Plicaturopsis crispa FD-325 SS-3]|uniref:DUF6534 domain-containing protein n=1 Tax=Plicaturopsis crispa FD-325 SS-3 TaxID=944288 RepID=A0A0C9T4Y9_PLICR|nr:hypothetical protein PLICRDRAFT_179652 [Plicaturopsis crispa FD-325 SS-3]
MAAPNIDNTLGILFDSVVCSSVLYGAGCLQCWVYWRSYRNRDPWYIKLLIASLLVCDTGQQVVLTVSVYDYAITNHGNPNILNALLQQVFLNPISVFFSNIIALLVQQFYCYRVLRISKRYVLQVPLSLFSLSAFGLLVGDLLCQSLDTFMELSTLKHLWMTCNLLAAGADISILVSLVWLLVASKTGLKHSNDLINRLILFTLNTGLLTSLCAIASCISIALSPTTFIYMFFFLIMGRLYTNSFLVTLNCREYIKTGGSRAGGEESFSMSFFQTMGMRDGRGAASNELSRFPNDYSGRDPVIAIRVDTSTQSVVDGRFGKAFETGRECGRWEHPDPDDIKPTPV